LQLGDCGNVFYNNLLSIPFVLIFIVINGEVSTIMNYEKIKEINYVMLIFNGLSGFCLNFSLFWVIRVTSPTTYSIAGALHKIPATVIGIVFFNTPFTFNGALAMSIALFGGVVYAFVKAKENHTETVQINNINNNQNEEETNIKNII